MADYYIVLFDSHINFKKLYRVMCNYKYIICHKKLDIRCLVKTVTLK